MVESYDFAGDDYAARNAAEARVELGRVVLAVTTALAEGPEALDPPRKAGAGAERGARRHGRAGDGPALNAARKALGR